MNTYKIQKCGARRCGTCPFVDNSNNFFSSSINLKCYPNTAGLAYLNCKTENVVYLISCKVCNFQYVGETKNSIQKRFSGHRSSIRKGESNQLIHKHFQEDCHGISNCSIFPIEKINATGLNHHNRNSIDQERALTRLRMDREKYWITTLQTAYPFGLNSRLKGVGDFQPSQGNFNRFGGRVRRRKKKHGQRKPKRLRVRHEVSLDFIIRKHRELSNREDYIHFFKTFLYGIPRSDLLNLRERVQNYQDNIEERVKDMILLISEQRLFKPVQISKIRGKAFLHMKFRDKGLDFINLSSILRKKEVTSNIPMYFTEKDPPIIGYRFNNSIAGKLFNYKETLNENGVQNYLDGRLSCECETSTYKDNVHNHIITGDLTIIKNNQLRDLIKKGPKYRLPQRIDWAKDRREIEDLIDSYAEKWINNERKTALNMTVNRGSLRLWKKSVMDQVDKKIEIGKQRFKKTWSAKIEGSMRRELEELKDKYVITVTDKAQNNILFTCKPFYISKVRDELNSPGQRTYQLDHISLEDIHRRVSDFSASKNIRVTDDMKEIPLIYWVPKMHKNPIGSRFIAGSKICSIKPLSQYFSKALKLILNHMKLYSATVLERANINYYWIIDNSLEFMDKIRNVRMEHMQTYDFSTLYPALPQAEIKKQFSKIFNKVFKREGKQFINVNFHKAYFSSRQNTKGCSFRLTDMIEVLEFMLDNIFVRFGNMVYKQVIGVPIGSDAGAEIANLLLFSYESEYIEKLSKQDITLARKFNLCSRYIDDLFVGNFPNFQEHIYNIYPRELAINLASNNTRDIAYLDLRIKIEDASLDFSIYDKRDDFNFEIINFPYIESCIPRKSALGVFYSQLIRYGRICSKISAFKIKSKGLIDKLKTQGYKIEDLRNISLRFFKEKREIVEKYSIDNGNDFIKTIFLG